MGRQFPDRSSIGSVDGVGEDFERVRSRLVALAYRLLGSKSEAEDVVQESFLRWLSSDTSAIERPAAWFSRVVTNLCLDRLGSARAKRESYAGPWLPEPFLTEGEKNDGAVDAESISLAFVALLERLSPSERAVYVLSESLDYTPGEIGEMLGKKPDAVRQLLHRAREHVEAGRPRFATSPDAHAALVATFLGMCESGEVEPLRSLLASEVVFVSDGGGRVRAALRPVVGADAVARLLAGLARKAPQELRIELRSVNGRPGIVGWLGDAPHLVMTVESDGERIFGVQLVLNPEKLWRFAGASPH